MKRFWNFVSTTAAPAPATTQATDTAAATEQAAATPAAATKPAAMASSSTDKLVIGMDDLMEAWESAMDSPQNEDLIKAIKNFELSTEVANDNNIPEYNEATLSVSNSIYNS